MAGLGAAVAYGCSTNPVSQLSSDPALPALLGGHRQNQRMAGLANLESGTDENNFLRLSAAVSVTAKVVSEFEQNGGINRN